MRGSSGGLMFFLFSFLLLLVSLEANSQIQSSSDATETTVTAELTTTQNTYECDQLDLSHPIDEIVTCTGPAIIIKSSPNVLDLSHYTDSQAEQLLINKQTNPPRTKFLQSSLVIIESQLTHLNLSLSYNVKNMEIQMISNQNLESVDIAATLFYPVKITIKGNKKMSQQTIELIKDKLDQITGDTYIQGFGECSPRPSHLNLDSFDYLNGCKYFNGDLIIDKNTDLRNPNIPFSEIQGCLIIKNTKLTDISFVDKINSTNCDQGKENLITGNSNLCLSSKRKSDLEKLLKARIENNQKCKDRCTAEWAKENNKTVKCDIIDGDLVIVGVSNVKDLEYLSNVVEIYGRLEVHHNFFTTFSLPKLNKVEHRIVDTPAIFIHDNSNLTSVNLSSLMYLTVHGAKGDVLIVQDNSEALVFDEDEVKKLGKLGMIRVPRAKNNKITQAPSGNTNSTKTTVFPGGAGSKEELEKKEKETEKKKEESSLALGLGLGLGLTALALIVIGAIIGVVVFLIIRKRKRIKQNQEMKKLKSTATTVEKKKTKEKKEYVVRVEEIPLYPEAKRRLVVDDDGKAADVDDFILLEWTEAQYIDEKQRHVKRDSRWTASYVHEWALHSKRKLPVHKLHANQDPKRIFVNKVTYKECTMGVNQAELKKLKIQKCDQYEDIEMFMKVHRTCLSQIEYTENVVEKVVKDFLEKYNHPKQLVKVQAKDHVCRIIGDVNGSIWDLLRVLKEDKAYRQHEHIFCGNYMNGSRHDLHTLLFLFACATHYKFTLLRGINEYGERAEEVVKNTLKHNFPKSSEETRKSLKNLILQAFEKLPFAALVNERALVVHGGISESWYNGVKNLDEAFDRLEMPLPAEIKPLQSKLISDLLYSEPSPVALPIAECGAGCYFDQIRLKKFLSKMDLDLLVTGRSNTGFDISMNNRLISLSCWFNKEFARYGPEYVFRDRKTYETQIKCQADNWPFGVLCLSPSGTITMELYRHSYVEKNMIEKDKRKPGILKTYQEDVEKAKAKWRKELNIWAHYGYTDENGIAHKGYFHIDKETEREERKKRKDLNSDVLEGWLADMSIEETLQHYKLVEYDPRESVAIKIFGYYKFICDEGRKIAFKLYEEDDVSPQDPGQYTYTEIFKRVENAMHMQRREGKTKPMPKEKKPNGNGLAEVKMPSEPVEYYSTNLVEDLKIWQLKKASWQEVYDYMSKRKRGYEMAVDIFKKEVRTLLDPPSTIKGSYFFGEKAKSWTDRGPEEKKNRWEYLSGLREKEKKRTAEIQKERDQYVYFY